MRNDNGRPIGVRGAKGEAGLKEFLTARIGNCCTIPFKAWTEMNNKTNNNHCKTSVNNGLVLEIVA